MIEENPTILKIDFILKSGDTDGNTRLKDILKESGDV